MEIYTGVEQLPKPLPFPVAAIGVFDGLHVGHQKVIRGLVERARRKEGTAMLITFTPHPQKVIALNQAPPLLQTFEQKREILHGLGVDILLRLPFTRQFSLHSPEQFAFGILIESGIAEVHVGRNFRFGHRRSGDFLTLERLGTELGFRVFGLPQVTFRDERVSSTRIRKLLGQGRVELAARLLGRPYEVCGTVVRGAGQGRVLGFPTANLRIENELTPAAGVYATRLEFEGRKHPAATNIGLRPTLTGGRPAAQTIESHVLDFEGDLYGKSVKLEFCLKLRDERRFESPENLASQISRDLKRARRYEARRKEVDCADSRR